MGVHFLLGFMITFAFINELNLEVKIPFMKQMEHKIEYI